MVFSGSRKNRWGDTLSAQSCTPAMCCEEKRQHCTEQKGQVERGEKLGTCACTLACFLMITIDKIHLSAKQLKKNEISAETPIFFHREHGCFYGTFSLNVFCSRGTCATQSITLCC